MKDNYKRMKEIQSYTAAKHSLFFFLSRSLMEAHMKKKKYRTISASSNSGRKKKKNVIGRRRSRERGKEKGKVVRAFLFLLARS